MEMMCEIKIFFLGLMEFAQPPEIPEPALPEWPIIF
jgi:hypothetical protein